MERKVSFLTFYELLKEKKIVYSLAKVFLMIGFFMFLMFSFINYVVTDDYEDYDTEEILDKGKAVKAEVIYLKEVTNVTINNDHPVEIYYKYEINGKQFNDTFQTLELEKVYDLESGSIIDVKTYKNQSVITNMEPFMFSASFVFSFFPIIFLTIGLLLLSIALIPALKKNKLYKNGKVTDAHFLGYSAVAGSPLSDKRLVNVDYYYFSNGNKIFGNSITDDWLYLPQTNREEIIKIFVSPDNPNLSCYIPRRTAIKNHWNINFD
ncbi:hypothetical protein WMW71_10975 [Flavobacterium buctense]|uniref:DUF3592 domain-containing protein n=1 Tax=Flavobacterium buctense TaxID=1648146 RepID=A0ABU9E4M9_9FLAO|nr:hypothetical protein [Flavobacterium buctense]